MGHDRWLMRLLPGRFRRLMLLCLLMAYAGASGAKPSPAAGDWPQFLGPGRNGVSDDAVRSTFPPAGPRVLWRKETGAGFSAPVIADGKLVLFHRVGDEERVDCLDAITGKELWSSAYPTAYIDDFGMDTGPRSTPAIADGLVYTFGADGELTCWKLDDGEHVWQINTRNDFASDKGFFGRACSPLIEGDAVILTLGGRDGAGVVAFDRLTGKVLWKALEDEAGYASPVAATFGEKRRVLAFTRSWLASLDPATGEVLFQFPWRARIHASVNAATPLVIDDHIFLSASYETGAVLLRYDEPMPEKVWAGDESLSNHYATSVHHDGFLYGFHGRQEQGPSLRCVELKTGKVRWSKDGVGAGTLLVAQDQLLILTEKGELLLAPATPDGFKESARAQVLPFDSRAHAALAGGLYYARGKRQLICLDLRTPDGE